MHSAVRYLTAESVWLQRCYDNAGRELGRTGSDQHLLLHQQAQLEREIHAMREAIQALRECGF